MSKYKIGPYAYGWLDTRTEQPLDRCKVCDTQMEYHVFGRPLMVCPACFPTEAGHL